MAVLRASGFSKISESSILFTHPAPKSSPYRNEGKVLDIESLTLAPVTNSKNIDGPIVSLAPRTGYMWLGITTASVGADVELGEAQDLKQVLDEKVREKHEYDNPPPTLTHVPANAYVDVIGVYEAKSGDDRRVMVHSAGTVRVTVTPSSSPLVLVLTNYEPVHWLIENPTGRKISAVFLSGYYESSVRGAGDAQVLRIGSDYAYKLDSPGYRALKNNVARYVSNPVHSFQGSYSSQNFTVTAF